MKTRIFDSTQKNSGRGRNKVVRGKLAPLFSQPLNKQQSESVAELIAKLNNYIQMLRKSEQFPPAHTGNDQVWRRRFAAMRAKMLSKVSAGTQTQEVPMKETPASISRQSKQKQSKARVDAPAHKANGVAAPKAIAKLIDITTRVGSKPLEAKKAGAAKSSAKPAAKPAAKAEVSKSTKSAASKADKSQKAAATKAAKSSVSVAKSSVKVVEKKAAKSSAQSGKSCCKSESAKPAKVASKSKSEASKPGKAPVKAEAVKQSKATKAAKPAAKPAAKANSSAKLNGKAPAKAAASKSPAKSKAAVASKASSKRAASSSAAARK